MFCQFCVFQFQERGASLAAGGREAGGDFVSGRVQNFAVVTPQLSQDHSRTDKIIPGRICRSPWLLVAGMSVSYRNTNHSWR
jgi:hypothetical protein